MYFCYIIYNREGRTYNGYTVNLKRRLRQHNGEIKGGARATRGKGPWSFLVVLTSPWWGSTSTAMQHEWSIKYPTRRRPRPKEFNGVLGRIHSLSAVFKHMRDKVMCTNILCYVQTDYIEHVRTICQEFEIMVHVMDISSVSMIDTTTTSSGNIV